MASSLTTQSPPIPQEDDEDRIPFQFSEEQRAALNQVLKGSAETGFFITGISNKGKT